MPQLLCERSVVTMQRGNVSVPACVCLCVCMVLHACLLFMFCECDLDKKKERKKKATPVPLTFPSCSHDELRGLFTCSWERFTDPRFVPKQSQKECRDIHKNNCSGTFTVIIVKGEMFFFFLPSL